MKRLTLVRHAKSSWAAPASPDRDRVLTDRGERDARIIGRRLVARRARPSLIISSSATRAVTTARALAAALGYPQEFLHLEDAAYLAAPDELLTLIGEQSDDFADLMIVGHNPGMTDLANRLLPSLGLDNLPTAGAIAIDIDVDKWDAVANGNASLAYYDYPKNPEVLLIED